jgi:hypothetical protein
MYLKTLYWVLGIVINSDILLIENLNISQFFDFISRNK